MPFSWGEFSRCIDAARDASNRHDSARALSSLDAALALMDGMPPPVSEASPRVTRLLRQGLLNARDAVWAMLYDQAWLDLDLVHALPAALAAGVPAVPALERYYEQALEPFRGRMRAV